MTKSTVVNFLSSILKNRIWFVLWQMFGRFFIMLVLPLLGWGINDIGGFLSNPVRAAIAVVVLTLAFHIGVMYWRLPPKLKDYPHDEEHWHYSLLELAFIISAYNDRRNVMVWSEDQTLRWIGVIIYLTGFIYAVWSSFVWVNHLRREGANALPNAPLISEGPYQWIRYPSMLSLLCYHIGFTLAFRSWAGVFFILPILYTLVRRVNLWDRDISLDHGELWEERKNNSKRVIPFVY